jgi:hypothetical protein
MTAILRVALLTALATVSIPAVAPAQGPAVDSLNRRVVLLERNVASLELRVLELEALIKNMPSQVQPVAASSKGQDLANWRRLSRGMTMAAVRGLLGVMAFPSLTIWGYTGAAAVTFSSDNEVQGWLEP